ncbi:MAG: isocitrate lyase/PEP mutase family protein [Chloroflexaceae bacterium]|nr:isocitrate lyase/PEP mutase family protein [Chloroflexaceae bacterium]
MLDMGTRATTLRRRIQSEQLIVAPGAFDPISARVLVQAGFDTIFISGYGLSVSTLGLPDIGVMSYSEVLERTRAIVDAVPVPVICDADTGYGGVHNVRRTVRDMEKIGAAAIILEDQESPKRCGHLPGKEVVPQSEMVQKLKVALDARQGDMLIVARTDAIQPNGFDDAIERANAYAETGVDIVFVEGLGDRDECRRAVEMVNAPLLANMIEGSITAYITTAELHEMGFKVALWPLSMLLTSITQMQRVAALLKSHGQLPAHILETTMKFPQFSEFWDVASYQETVDRYVLPNA